MSPMLSQGMPAPEPAGEETAEPLAGQEVEPLLGRATKALTALARKPLLNQAVGAFADPATEPIAEAFALPAAEPVAGAFALPAAEPAGAQVALPAAGSFAASVPVVVSMFDQRAAYDHNVQVRAIKQRRLQWRQLQAARFGDSADPSIGMEIEDLEQELRDLGARIAQYAPNIATLADCATILSVEQQREIMLAIARTGIVPPDKIKLIDIVIGSVVLVVELPLEGAARLVAMQRLNHPALRAQGFANVALDQVVDTQGKSLDSMFDRAVRFEQTELQSKEPPDEAADHPYANIGGEARLRITLADETVRHQ